MMTVKQVATLTGVIVRTLQFYDEIGLLKPAQTTAAGYRLYDEETLETLQQILFFKELDFTLKEIKTIMADPQFDKTAAFAKQRELITLKRDRLDGLLGLLDRLLKGEDHMDFDKFDMSTYFQLLEDFKQAHTADIIQQMGSLEEYDHMLSELRANETQIAEMALRTHGSLEAFTNAMEKNMTQFFTKGPAITPEEAASLTEITKMLTQKLTSDLTKDVTAPDVQAATRELITFTTLCNRSTETGELGDPYWSFMADCYLTNPAFIQATDDQYGQGAAQFIGEAIKAYLTKHHE